MLNIHFAPLQGYTEDSYRRIHHKVCGGISSYYTPFVRWEHGSVRSKDKRDIRAQFNEGVPVVPQIIASEPDEMQKLIDAVQSEGYTRIDLNMGCPFPLQTRHAHGAGILPHPEKVATLCQIIEKEKQISFSVKMRLGLNSADEWKEILPILNGTPLQHVTLHPRIGAQQYKGMVDMNSFQEFQQQCQHPIIYNGDITTVDDILRIEQQFPTLSGIMIGRGLLARPTLAMEYANGTALTDAQVTSTLVQMHQLLLEHQQTVIPGEAALLNKIRTFWDYTEPTIGHKAWKKLKKAGNLKNYLATVNWI